MVTASRALVGLTFLAFAACASGSRGNTEADGMNPVVSSDEAGGVPKWTGSLIPTTQRSGALAPRGQTKAFGTVELTPASDGPTRTRARITLSAPVQNRPLSWAVLPGRCGSPSTPLVAIDLFPALEMSANGRGQLDAVIPMSFMGDGSYHVAVYWNRGADVADIMTCANLKRS